MEHWNICCNKSNMGIMVQIGSEPTCLEIESLFWKRVQIELVKLLIGRFIVSHENVEDERLRGMIKFWK